MKPSLHNRVRKIEVDAPWDKDEYLSSMRCNECKANQLRKKLGKTFLLLTVEGWPTVYEIGKPPIENQGEPKQHEGKPIRFRISFMALGHTYDKDCKARKR